MKNLKLLREQAHLNQREMALKLNLTKATYARYEIGETEPSFDTLIKMAVFFNCSVDYLLGHQTTDTLYLSGFSETQKKIITLVKKLNNDQAAFTLGYLADMLKISYAEVRPTRPF